MAWEISSSDGREYYFNTETGDVSWDCPQELLDVDGDFVWVSHDEDMFVPGKVLNVEDDESVLVELEGGHTMYTSSLCIADSIPSMSSLLRLPPDLIDIDVINEPSVLYTLRHRYGRDDIYTSLGDILVVVNPFKNLPTPSYEIYMDAYRAVEDVTVRLPPHPFATAAEAYNKLIHNHTSQTILIGGESGAGKTETTKTCLRFLSLVAGSGQDSDVEEAVMSANPILEAFGNAKTIRNDNSSRFGKFMELTYSSTGFILRSSTTNFLLEKCRVHRQGTGERSFHIFYQLCRAAEYATNALASSYDDNGEPLSPMVSYASTLDSQADGQREGGGEAKGHCSVLDDADFLRSLSLGPPEQFDYLSQSGCVNITGLDDVRGLIATESAASTLGLGEQSVRSLFALCAAVLHLGNICFRDTNTADGMEYCEVMDDDKCKRALRSVSLLLGLSEQDLVQGLSSREISIRGERTTVRLTARQSLESRDALSKSLFSNAFNWIVRNVNVTFTPPVQSAARRPSIAAGAKSKENFIGILDIFGFEIFDSNSLEQLCINYANEKLQELFNRNVFKKEEQLYSEEGIPFDELIFADNQDVLNLIEDKHVGILSIVDDEVNIPRATDLTLLRKLNQAHLTAASGNDSGAIKNKVMGSAASGKERALVSASKRFLPATSAANDSFVIDHFAGRVEYSIEDFLDSSRDRVSDDIQLLLDSCAMASVVAPRDVGSKGTDGRNPRGGSRVQTLGKKFKLQLEDLMSTLNDTEPHYIKCIKPNSLKVPNCFHGTMSYQQLKASGIFEAVEIRSRGYNVRYSHTEFLLQYGPLGGLNGLGKSNNLKARCASVVDAIAREMGVEGSSVGLYVGKTRVFSKYEQNRVLVQMLATLRRHSVLKMQRICLGFVTRLRYAAYRDAVVQAQEALGLPNCPDSLEHIDAALSSLEKFHYQHFQMLCEKKANIVERQRIADELEGLCHVLMRDIDNQWLETVTKAREMAISGETAKRLYDMQRDFELMVACDLHNQSLVSAECSDVKELERALAEVQQLKGRLGADCFRDDESALRQMLEAARLGRTVDLTAHQRRHQEQQQSDLLLHWQSAAPFGGSCTDNVDARVRGPQNICSHCRELFQRPPQARAPKYLNCMHTYCTKCLLDLYDSNQGGVACPSCDVITKCGVRGVVDLNTNFVIVANVPPLCDNCENEVALFKCIHCPADCTRLCRLCAGRHQQIKAFRHHSVINLTPRDDAADAVYADDEAGVCPVHPTKRLDAFCCDCRQVICLSCGVFKHSNHEIVPAEHALEQERAVTAHCLSATKADISVLEKMELDLRGVEPALSAQKRMMEEVTGVVFAGLRKLVKNRHADLLSSLEVLYGQKWKDLVGSIDELSFQIDCLQSAASTSSQIVEEEDSVRLLEIIPTVQQHLQSLLQFPLKVNHSIDSDLAFTAGPEMEVKRLMECVGLCRGTVDCADAFQCSVEVIQSGEFTGSWRVMLLLTSRNMSGVRLERGGLPVTFEVSDRKTEVMRNEALSPLATCYDDPGTEPSAAREWMKNASVAPSGLMPKNGDAVLSTGSKRVASYVPSNRRGSSGTSAAAVPHLIENKHPTAPVPVVASPYITTIADNNDGTYFLLLSPRDQSRSRGEVTIVVKIFGQHVRGSPMTLSLDSLACCEVWTLDDNCESGDEVPMHNNTSSSRDDISTLSTDTRTVESFFKYITGGLL